VNSKQNKKRVSLSVSNTLKGMLDEIKHTGQSYDGLIRELVIYQNKHQGQERKQYEKDRPAS